MQKSAFADVVAIAFCTLAWGTTWYAITLQFGVVDAVVSIVYRFALSAAILFLWVLVRREKLTLSPAQHWAALGVGFCTFTINYAFVYWAETRVASAVVAVIFAGHAFVNLVVFSAVFRDRAPAAAWIAASLGAVGVAVLSWGEIMSAEFGERALVGVLLTLGAVIGAAFGNVYARRGELAGAPVASFTGWAMAYGAAILALFATATGRPWLFSATWPYVLSLLHLSIVGSVVAFMLYFGLARRRGFAAASYIAALTPPVAMLMSTLFEAKTWSPAALSGVALILAGQWLLLRTRTAPAPAD